MENASNSSKRLDLCIKTKVFSRITLFLRLSKTLLPYKSIFVKCWWGSIETFPIHSDIEPRRSLRSRLNRGQRKTRGKSLLESCVTSLESHWNLIRIYWNLRISQESFRIFGILSESLESYRNLWNLIRIPGISLESLESH